VLYIFDWDGTLMDSTNKIVRCMQLAIAKHGLSERDDADVKQIIGLGLPEAIQHLYPQITLQQVNDVRDSYSRFFIDADQSPCNFYPNVLAVLDQLRSSGHLLAVATGKSRKGLNRVLDNLEMSDFFDAQRCADETASKPSPMMLEQILMELDCDADKAVMVGDTEFDLAMANNAGMKSIAVSYGAHAVERLLPHRPELLMDRFDQLLDWQG
jgi:phosphoglycolate phosphatase